MKTIMRIALAFCWSIIPLQSWLVMLGGLLMAFSVFLAFTVENAQNMAVMATVGMVGAIIIAFVPGLAGGPSLRFASSRSMLHLRPHGRTRMLAGSLLAITLLAMLIALPALLSQLTSQLRAFDMPSRGLHPGPTFAVSWSVLAALWIAGFVLSSSRLLSFLAMFAPMFILPTFLIRKSHTAYDMPGPFWWLAATMAAWLVFAIWYMQSRSIRAPRWFGDRSTQNFENSPMGIVASSLGFSGGAMSRQRASSQLLLGAVSPFRYAVMLIAWIAAVLLALTLFGPGRERAQAPGILLLFGAMSGGQLAYMAARRARLLWLRTGSDRASLYAMAERSGLAAVMWLLALAAALLVGLALLRNPERAGQLLLCATALVPLWAAVFYCGMSLTRGWTLEEVLVSFAVAILFIGEAAAIRPDGNASPAVLGGAAAVSLVAALLLRAYSRRRWLALDWRIARLPTLIQRPN